MNETDSTEVSRLLQAMRAGEAGAGERFFPLVYDELRRAAGRLLSSERRNHTFDPTDLVHEAWLRLGLAAGRDGAPIPVESRAHFVSITVRAMRRALIDHSRRRGAEKRGAGAVRVTLDERDGVRNTSPESMLALLDALEVLGTIDPRLQQVVESRFVVGLTEQETALSLGVTLRTVQRDWVKARAWLYRQLYGEETTT